MIRNFDNILNVGGAAFERYVKGAKIRVDEKLDDDSYNVRIRDYIQNINYSKNLPFGNVDGVPVDDDDPNPDLFKNNWFPNDRKILGMPEPTDDNYFVKVDIGDGDNYEPTVTDAKQYGCTDPDNINYEQFKGSQEECPTKQGDTAHGITKFIGEYGPDNLLYDYQCPHSHCNTEAEIFKDNSGIPQTNTITGLGYAASSADAESRLESYPPRWIPAPIDDMRDPDCELIQWIPDMNAPYLQHDHDLDNQELFEVFTHTSAINDPSRTHLRTSDCYKYYGKTEHGFAQCVPKNMDDVDKTLIRDQSTLDENYSRSAEDLSDLNEFGHVRGLPKMCVPATKKFKRNDTDGDPTANDDVNVGPYANQTFNGNLPTKHNRIKLGDGKGCGNVSNYGLGGGGGKDYYDVDGSFDCNRFYQKIEVPEDQKTIGGDFKYSPRAPDDAQPPIYLGDYFNEGGTVDYNHENGYRNWHLGSLPLDLTGDKTYNDNELNFTCQNKPPFVLSNNLNPRSCPSGYSPIGESKTGLDNDQNTVPDHDVNQELCAFAVKSYFNNPNQSPLVDMGIPYIDMGFSSGTHPIFFGGSGKGGTDPNKSGIGRFLPGHKNFFIKDSYNPVCKDNILCKMMEEATDAYTEQGKEKFSFNFLRREPLKEAKIDRFLENLHAGHPSLDHIKHHFKFCDQIPTDYQTSDDKCLDRTAIHAADGKNGKTIFYGDEKNPDGTEVVDGEELENIYKFMHHDAQKNFFLPREHQLKVDWDDGLNDWTQKMIRDRTLPVHGNDYYVKNAYQNRFAKIGDPKNLFFTDSLFYQELKVCSNTFLECNDDGDCGGGATCQRGVSNMIFNQGLSWDNNKFQYPTNNINFLTFDPELHPSFLAKTSTDTLGKTISNEIEKLKIATEIRDLLGGPTTTLSIDTKQDLSSGPHNFLKENIGLISDAGELDFDDPGNFGSDFTYSPWIMDTPLMPSGCVYSTTDTTVPTGVQNTEDLKTFFDGELQVFPVVHDHDCPILSSSGEEVSTGPGRQRYGITPVCESGALTGHSCLKNGLPDDGKCKHKSSHPCQDAREHNAGDKLADERCTSLANEVKYNAVPHDRVAYFRYNRHNHVKDLGENISSSSIEDTAMKFMRPLDFDSQTGVQTVDVEDAKTKLIMEPAHANSNYLQQTADFRKLQGLLGIASTQNGVCVPIAETECKSLQRKYDYHFDRGSGYEKEEIEPLVMTDEGGVNSKYFPAMEKTCHHIKDTDLPDSYGKTFNSPGPQEGTVSLDQTNKLEMHHKPKVCHGPIDDDFCRVTDDAGNYHEFPYAWCAYPTKDTRAIDTTHRFYDYLGDDSKIRNIHEQFFDTTISVNFGNRDYKHTKPFISTYSPKHNVPHVYVYDPADKDNDRAVLYLEDNKLWFETHTEVFGFENGIPIELIGGAAGYASEIEYWTNLLLNETPIDPADPANDVRKSFKLYTKENCESSSTRDFYNSATFWDDVNQTCFKSNTNVIGGMGQHFYEWDEINSCCHARSNSPVELLGKDFKTVCVDDNFQQLYMKSKINPNWRRPGRDVIEYTFADNNSAEITVDNDFTATQPLDHKLLCPVLTKSTICPGVGTNLPNCSDDGLQQYDNCVGDKYCGNDYTDLGSDFNYDYVVNCPEISPNKTIYDVSVLNTEDKNLHEPKFAKNLEVKELGGTVKTCDIRSGHKYGKSCVNDDDCIPGTNEYDLNRSDYNQAKCVEESSKFCLATDHYGIGDGTPTRPPAIEFATGPYYLNQTGKYEDACPTDYEEITDEHECKQAYDYLHASVDDAFRHVGETLSDNFRRLSSDSTLPMDYSNIYAHHSPQCEGLSGELKNKCYEMAAGVYFNDDSCPTCGPKIRADVAISRYSCQGNLGIYSRTDGQSCTKNEDCENKRCGGLDDGVSCLTDDDCVNVCKPYVDGGTVVNPTMGKRPPDCPTPDQMTCQNVNNNVCAERTDNLLKTLYDEQIWPMYAGGNAGKFIPPGCTWRSNHNKTDTHLIKDNEHIHGKGSINPLKIYENSKELGKEKYKYISPYVGGGSFPGAEADNLRDNSRVTFDFKDVKPKYNDIIKSGQLFDLSTGGQLDLFSTVGLRDGQRDSSACNENKYIAGDDAEKNECDTDTYGSKHTAELCDFNDEKFCNFTKFEEPSRKFCQFFHRSTTDLAPQQSIRTDQTSFSRVLEAGVSRDDCEQLTHYKGQKYEWDESSSRCQLQNYLRDDETDGELKILCKTDADCEGFGVLDQDFIDRNNDPDTGAPLPFSLKNGACGKQYRMDAIQNDDVNTSEACKNACVAIRNCVAHQFFGDSGGCQLVIDEMRVVNEFYDQAGRCSDTGTNCVTNADCGAGDATCDPIVTGRCSDTRTNCVTNDDCAGDSTCDPKKWYEYNTLSQMTKEEGAALKAFEGFDGFEQVCNNLGGTVDYEVIDTPNKYNCWGGLSRLSFPIDNDDALQSFQGHILSNGVTHEPYQPPAEFSNKYLHYHSVHGDGGYLIAPGGWSNRYRDERQLSTNPLNFYKTWGTAEGAAGQADENEYSNRQRHPNTTIDDFTMLARCSDTDTNCTSNDDCVAGRAWRAGDATCEANEISLMPNGVFPGTKFARTKPRIFDVKETGVPDFNLIDVPYTLENAYDADTCPNLIALDEQPDPLTDVPSCDDPNLALNDICRGTGKCGTEAKAWHERYGDSASGGHTRSSNGAVVSSSQLGNVGTFPRQDDEFRFDVPAYNYYRSRCSKEPNQIYTTPDRCVFTWLGETPGNVGYKIRASSFYHDMPQAADGPYNTQYFGQPDTKYMPHKAMRNASKHVKNCEWRRRYPTSGPGWSASPDYFYANPGYSNDWFYYRTDNGVAGYHRNRCTYFGTEFNGESCSNDYDCFCDEEDENCWEVNKCVNNTDIDWDRREGVLLDGAGVVRNEFLIQYASALYGSWDGTNQMYFGSGPTHSGAFDTDYDLRTNLCHEDEFWSSERGLYYHYCESGLGASQHGMDHLCTDDLDNIGEYYGYYGTKRRLSAIEDENGHADFSTIEGEWIEFEMPPGSYVRPTTIQVGSVAGAYEGAHTAGLNNEDLAFSGSPKDWKVYGYVPSGFREGGDPMWRELVSKSDEVPSIGLNGSSYDCGDGVDTDVADANCTALYTKFALVIKKIHGDPTVFSYGYGGDGIDEVSMATVAHFRVEGHEIDGGQDAQLYKVSSLDRGTCIGGDKDGDDCSDNYACPSGSCDTSPAARPQKWETFLPNWKYHKNTSGFDFSIYDDDEIDGLNEQFKSCAMACDHSVYGFYGLKTCSNAGDLCTSDNDCAGSDRCEGLATTSSTTMSDKYSAGCTNDCCYKTCLEQLEEDDDVSNKTSLNGGKGKPADCAQYCYSDEDDPSNQGIPTYSENIELPENFRNDIYSKITIDDEEGLKDYFLDFDSKQRPGELSSRCYTKCEEHADNGKERAACANTCYGNPPFHVVNNENMLFNYLENDETVTYNYEPFLGEIQKMDKDSAVCTYKKSGVDGDWVTTDFVCESDFQCSDVFQKSTRHSHACIQPSSAWTIGDQCVLHTEFDGGGSPVYPGPSEPTPVCYNGKTISEQACEKYADAMGLDFYSNQLSPTDTTGTRPNGCVNPYGCYEVSGMFHWVGYNTTSDCGSVGENFEFAKVTPKEESTGFCMSTEDLSSFTSDDFANLDDCNFDTDCADSATCFPYHQHCVKYLTDPGLDPRIGFIGDYEMPFNVNDGDPLNNLNANKACCWKSCSSDLTGPKTDQDIKACVAACFSNPVSQDQESTETGPPVITLSDKVMGATLSVSSAKPVLSHLDDWGGSRSEADFFDGDKSAPIGCFNTCVDATKSIANKHDGIDFTQVCAKACYAGSISYPSNSYNNYRVLPENPVTSTSKHYEANKLSEFMNADARFTCRQPTCKIDYCSALGLTKQGDDCVVRTEDQCGKLPNGHWENDECYKQEDPSLEQKIYGNSRYPHQKVCKYKNPFIADDADDAGEVTSARDPSYDTTRQTTLTPPTLPVKTACESSGYHARSDVLHNHDLVSLESGVDTDRDLWGDGVEGFSKFSSFDFTSVLDTFCYEDTFHNRSDAPKKPIDADGYVSYNRGYSGFIDFEKIDKAEFSIANVGNIPWAEKRCSGGSEIDTPNAASISCSTNEPCPTGAGTCTWDTSSVSHNSMTVIDDVEMTEFTKQFNPHKDTGKYEEYCAKRCYLKNTEENPDECAAWLLDITEPDEIPQCVLFANYDDNGNAIFWDDLNTKFTQNFDDACRDDKNETQDGEGHQCEKNKDTKQIMGFSYSIFNKLNAKGNDLVTNDVRDSEQLATNNITEQVAKNICGIGAGHDALRGCTSVKDVFASASSDLDAEPQWTCDNLSSFLSDDVLDCSNFYEERADGLKYKCAADTLDLSQFPINFQKCKAQSKPINYYEGGFDNYYRDVGCAEKVTLKEIEAVSDWDANSFGSSPTNIGTVTAVSPTWNVTPNQWAVDTTDGSIILTQSPSALGSYTLYVKITQDGVLIPNSQRLSAGTTPFSDAATLISAYNASGSYNNATSQGFIKAANFPDGMYFPKTDKFKTQKSISTIVTPDAPGLETFTIGTDYKALLYKCTGVVSPGEDCPDQSFTIEEGGKDIDFLVLAGGGSGGSANSAVDITNSRNTGGGGAGGYRTSYNNHDDEDPEDADALLFKEPKLNLSPGIFEVRVGRGGVSDTISKMNGGDSYISAPKKLGRCKYFLDDDEFYEDEDEDEFYEGKCNKTSDCATRSAGDDGSLLECEHNLNANFRTDNYVLSKGGGYGGNNRIIFPLPSEFKNGGDGGSGGGAFYNAYDDVTDYWRDPPGQGVAGRGIANQGFDGFDGFCVGGTNEDGFCVPSQAWQSGGGGGAGEGKTVENVSQKDGGDGRASSITGNLMYRGGGGGAGAAEIAGVGGVGGGGNGSLGGYFISNGEGCDVNGFGCQARSGDDGLFCHGGGGGGSFQYQSGGNGGSGVVIVRYKHDDLEAREYNSINCTSGLFSDLPTFWDETTQTCYEVENKELDVLAKTKVDDCGDKHFMFQRDDPKRPDVACDDYFVLRDIDEAQHEDCPVAGRHKSAFLCDVNLENVEQEDHNVLKVHCKNPADNAKPVCEGCIGFTFEDPELNPNQEYTVNPIQNKYTSFFLNFD